jgi:hypothetical protein
VESVESVDDDEVQRDDVEEPVEGDPPEDLESGEETWGEDASAEPPEDSLRFDRWRRRSAAGAMMTGIAFGMQEALDRKRKEAPIVQQVDGDPGPQGPIELQFDPDHPENTVAVIRPWLMDGGGTPPERPGGEATSEPSDT